jgi:hypothetical protein
MNGRPARRRRHPGIGVSGIVTAKSAGVLRHLFRDGAKRTKSRGDE